MQYALRLVVRRMQKKWLKSSYYVNQRLKYHIIDNQLIFCEKEFPTIISANAVFLPLRQNVKIIKYLFFVWENVNCWVMYYPIQRRVVQAESEKQNIGVMFCPIQRRRHTVHRNSYLFIIWRFSTNRVDLYFNCSWKKATYTDWLLCAVCIRLCMGMG